MAFSTITRRQEPRTTLRRLKRLEPQFVSIVSRLPVVALVCAAALLAGVALAWAQSGVTSTQNTASDGSASNAAPATLPGVDHRMREGAEIVGETGCFRVTGDRVAFFTNNGQKRFVGLENLNLQRIVRVIADNPAEMQWDITGTVTEYLGTNFLLVHRAVLRNPAQSSERDR